MTSEAALLEQHRTLIRFEHAAGAAFGYDEVEAARPARFLIAPAALALATLATAVAATITYLV